ncbi:SDR family NAD(P)-dependent oxidoreductase [Hyphococcus sp.]|uniref:SDR family NAD(P)-dependent oxidoreductase n=1 Tax=Hyphococcus sp. TaxID=2038636 RepID=UPI003CCC456C
MSAIKDKAAIVLGAAGAGNMGQVIAQRFANEGAKVMVAGRHEDELKRFAETINGAYALCDITQRADLDALVTKTVDAYGGVDIAVNATGWGLVKRFEKTTEEEIDKVSALQFKGPFLFFQAVIEAMRERGGGSIIQISSATATVMLNHHAAYMGTKAGTDHVIRCVAHDFGRYGIRANSVSPGFTRTPMTEDAAKTPGLEEAFIKEYPLGRVGTSDDIAAACVFLASDECFMTGQNLQVNGGLTLRRNPMQAEINASIAAAKSDG